MEEPGRVRRTAVLTAALIAVATIGVTEAAAQDVVVRAAAGIGQAVKAGRWAPVLIDIDSTRPAFNGELIVSWGDVRVRRALALPSPGHRQIELYLRNPDPQDTIRVRLVAGEREIQSVDLPVRVVAPNEPVTLCVESGSETAQDECTARASIASLPRSARGYDAVDRIVTAAGLSEEQRTAIARREALRALDLSGDAGLVQRPARPERRRGLPTGVARTSGAIVLMCAAGLAAVGIAMARRRSRVRWVWLSATAVIVVATVAAQAVGRIGPGTAVTVYYSALLEQVPGTSGSVLSMRALAEFPAHDSFTLRLPVADGTIEPAALTEGSSEQVFDESGQPLITGVFGLAARQGFAAEAILDVQPLSVSQRGSEWTVTNRSNQVLERCRFADGFTRTDVGTLLPEKTVSAEQSGEVIGPVFTCEASEPALSMQSREHRIDMQGVTIIATYQNRANAAPGADD